jgi:hypothetical protein
MNTIHVSHIDSNHKPRPSVSRPGLWESEAWVISEKRASLLKGGKFYAHTSRQEPSFDGGSIKDYELVKPKNGYTRVKFYYRPEKSSIGIIAPTSGWRNEYRIYIQNEKK